MFLGLAVYFWVKGLYKKWRKNKVSCCSPVCRDVDKVACEAALCLDGARGTRTLTAFQPRDFKSLVSTISPPPHACVVT